MSRRGALPEDLELRMQSVARLYTQARHSGEVAPLEQALALARGVFSALTEARTAHAGVSAELGRCLSLCYRLNGDEAALHEAIDVFRAGIADADEDDPDLLGCLNNLGNALADWYQLTKEAAALDENEKVFLRAVQSVSPGDWRLGTLLNGLGDALLNRYWATGLIDDLDQAIRAMRSATAACDPADPFFPILLNNLANVLIERYERFRDTDALAEAEHALRQGIEATDAGTPDRAMVLETLGALLNLRYDASGDIAVLNEAEWLLSECVAIAPAGDPTRGTRLNTLGVTRRSRYLATGDPRAQREAVDAFRAAVASTKEGHQHRAACLANLSNVLLERYESVGDLGALDEAIAVLRHATGIVQPPDPRSALYLSGLANALRIRYGHLGEQVDLATAEAAARQAVEVSPPGDALRPMFLDSLAIVLHSRYDDGKDPDALESAEKTLRSALAVIPAGDPRRLGCLADLGNVLRDRFRRTQHAAVLGEAVDALRQAARIAARGDARRSGVLVNLGESLGEQYAGHAVPSLLAEAVSVLSEAAGTLTAPPRQRAHAARVMGRIAASAGLWDQAADAYRLAIDLLPTVASHELDRQHKEHSLAEFTGLGCDAAAAALNCDEAYEAVSLLERGRGVMFTQALQLRTELDDLRKIAPDLAGRFRQLGQLMESPATSAEPARHIAAHSTRSGTRALALTDDFARREQLKRDWDQALSDIRDVPGFETFLQPPVPREVINDAGAGPVALINVSRHRSDALIVTCGALQVIPLPLATPGAVSYQADKFLGAIQAVLDPARDPDRMRQADRTLLDILAWLWAAVGEPVTDALASSGQSAPGNIGQRLWWVPTGFLSMLPLHAAGEYDQSSAPQAHSVPGRVVSSYLPTIRAHHRARGDRSPRTVGQTLVVAMPDTPGSDPLPAAAAEGDAVAQLSPYGCRLSGATATRDRILAELPRHANFHFAGHAYGDLTDPSASALFLHDSPVTVRDISLLRMTDANLAYLSACETAVSGLPAIDEAISIASGCNLAGYRHVVATLWPVPDSVAAAIATHVWRAVSDENGTECTASALHQVTSEQRRRFPGQPSRWAAHIHVGP